MTPRFDSYEWPISELKDWKPATASIIIDNYNYAKFLPEAIESAVGQTQKSQIIVVDDGSKDNSREVISGYGEQILKVFKKNGGQASAFNAGFALATGDLIFFLDSDDMLENDAIETVLSAWRPGTAMAHFSMTIIDSAGHPLGLIPDPNAGLADGDVRPLLLTEGGYPTTVTTGLAFARRALGKVMPMPEHKFVYSADGYLVHAIPFFGGLQKIEKILARYRIHGGNATDVWGDPGGYAAGFRRKIGYAQNEFEAVKKFAGEFKIPVSPGLGERDPDYLGYRLFSLLLDPARHPVPGDRRMSLLLRYILRRWKSPWSLRRRLSSIVFPVLAAFSNSSTSARLIQIMSDATARPHWFSTLAGWLRRRQGGDPHLPDSPRNE